MEQKKERKMGRLVAFWARTACFFLLVSAVLSYTGYVLTPKKTYGICSMLNLYRQPRNTVDVLTVGTSIAYAGINTNVLWREYGIASYNLCSAEQPFWVSYYALREALKLQKPKLILLDAKPAIYLDEYSKRGRTIMSTYGILGLENRFGAIAACVESRWQAAKLMVMYPEIHNRYARLEAQDWRLPPDNGGRGETWKGYIEEDRVERHSRPTMIWSKTRIPMEEREEEYARKIFELAKEHGIPLLLVCLPNPDYESDHMYFNYLWEVAEECGVAYLNYNAPKLRYGLRFSSDFADWQHLNVKGSVTFSKRLGKDLVQRFHLPDRRKDQRYASWEECAERWYALYPTFESSGLEAQP